MITYSFIIPHHNSPSLLNRCIESIPEREDIQIIVVDDNSDTNAKPQINRKDVEVLYIGAHNTKGAGRARNEGLKLARGKWLLFADCDDYYKKGFIDTLDKHINDDIDVLFFNFEYRDGATGNLLEPLSFERYISQFDNKEQAIENIKFHHNVPWTKMVSLELIKKYNILFEETPKGNDIWFSMQVGYYSTRIAVEPLPVYVYLKNEGSLINRKNIPIPFALCNIEHRAKLNEWQKFIGHPEWNISLLKTCGSYIKKLGVPFAIMLLKNIMSIMQNRDEWVSHVKKINK